MTDEEQQKVTAFENIALIGKAAEALAIAAKANGLQPDDLVQLITAIAKKKM